MSSRLLLILAVYALAPSAQAHGEEVLGSIYAQFAAVIGTFILLGAVPSLRKHATAGVVGCLLGVVVSWVATGNVPYMQYRALITATDVIAPFLFSLLAVLVHSRHASR